jgi:hypothetical protein
MSQWLTHYHSEPHVELMPLETSTNPRFLHGEAIRLIGAHGEEIVRSIYVDELVSNSGNLHQKRSSNSYHSLESSIQPARTDT